MNDIDWELYEQHVRELEEQGLDRSDAQAVVDAEILKSKQGE